ncbi:chitin deacetylase [Coelomomyces lativittatus]|nr:chitin deacetylase [Coelomomyces lativittatus]KAJ1510393.1 chitin deacetylase [Coelomomyces lativittatus]KAJ1518383.1 chitin deacetylase [Coelomomyces lativittatus]
MRVFLNFVIYFSFFFSFTLSAQVPDLATWCPNCPIPPTTVLQNLFNLQDTVFKTTGNCGDNICNTAIGEHCGTCPGDCGKCEFSTLISSCVSPGQISLTFDDGPTTLLSGYLDTLKSNNVTASFFLNGVHIMETININSIQGKTAGWTASPLSQLVKRAHDEGHIIGTHTYSHVGVALGTTDENVPSPAKSISLSTLRMQMLVNDLVVYDILQKYPLAFRPPYLEMNSTVLNALESMGYLPISINLDTTDFSGVPSNEITKIVTNAVNAKSHKNGFLVLQHDGYPNSLQALAQFIPLVKQAGMTFVDLPTCLGKPVSSFYRSANQSLFNKGNANSSSSPPSPSLPSNATNTSSTLVSPTSVPTSKSASSSKSQLESSFSLSMIRISLFVNVFSTLFFFLFM